MKSKLKHLAILSAIAVMLFTGCIDYSSTVKVKPDGSGTIEETVFLSEMLTDMMSAFSSEYSDSSMDGTGPGLFTEEELAEDAATFGEGVVYVSSKQVERDGQKGYTAVYRFDDITKLRLSDDPSEKIPGDGLMMPEPEAENDTATIRFAFQKGDISTLNIFMPKPDFDDTTDFDTEDEPADSAGIGPIDESVKMILKDFRLSMKLEIMGNIIETNASYKDSNTISLLEMNLGELLEDEGKLKELEKLHAKSIEQAREILKDIPGFKIETEPKVTVKFN